MNSIVYVILLIGVAIVKAVMENKAKAKRAQQGQPKPMPEEEEVYSDEYNETYEDEEEVPYQPIMPEIQQPVQVPPIAVREIHRKVERPVVDMTIKQHGGQPIRIDEVEEKTNDVVFSVEEMRKAVIYNAILTRPNY